MYSHYYVTDRMFGALGECGCSPEETDRRQKQGEKHRAGGMQGQGVIGAQGGGCRRTCQSPGHTVSHQCGMDSDQ